MALDAEMDWAKVLSVGEQQRLAIARVLLAKPRFAMLDEATSALDVANEQTLYRHLSETSTTLVSVSHRSTILKYHHQVLGTHWRWKMGASSRTELPFPRVAGHEALDPAVIPRPWIEAETRIPSELMHHGYGPATRASSWTGAISRLLNAMFTPIITSAANTVRTMTSGWMASMSMRSASSSVQNQLVTWMTE